MATPAPARPAVRPERTVWLHALNHPRLPADVAELLDTAVRGDLTVARVGTHVSASGQLTVDLFDADHPETRVRLFVPARTRSGLARRPVDVFSLVSATGTRRRLANADAAAFEIGRMGDARRAAQGRRWLAARRNDCEVDHAQRRHAVRVVQDAQERRAARLRKRAITGA